MKSIVGALMLFKLLPFAVALEGTSSSSAATGDHKSLTATKTKDASIVAKSSEEELRAEIRKEVQHELSVHDVQREVLVQSSTHNAGGSASMMEKMRVLKALEQKEHKNAKLLAQANKKLHDRTRRLKGLFLEERATVKADSKQLQLLKQQQKTTAGAVQKLKAEIHSMQLQAASLQASLAHEKQMSGKIREEFSKLQVSDASLARNFTKLSNTSKLNEQKLKKQGLFLLTEIHSARDQVKGLQQNKHKMELQNKEKEHELTSVKASMLQENQKLQTQSQRELNAEKKKFAALEEQRKKESNKYLAEIQVGTSSLSKLRATLAESRSAQKATAAQLAALKLTNGRLLTSDKELSDQMAEIQAKTNAALSAKEKSVNALEHSASQQLQTIKGLQAVASRTAAELETSTTAESSEKAQISTLNQNAAAQKAQIMSALKEIASQQEKLESQAQSESALARQSLAAQAQARSEISMKDAQYMSLKQMYSLSESESASAQAQIKQQSAQVQQLKNQIAAAQASATKQINSLQGKLHTVMLSAAQQVRELEDELEQGQELVKRKEAALLQASTEASTEREAAENANAEAVKVSREAELSKNALSASQSAAEAAASHAKAAEQDADNLRLQLKQKEGLLQTIRDRTQLAEAWQEKAETYMRKYANEASELQTETKNAQQLSERVEELGDSDRRASLLQSQLRSVQQQQAAKDKEIADLKQRHLMLEQLNDHFSQQMDFYVNASKTWHAKADEVQEQLDKRTAQLQVALRKRTEAQQVEKDSRNQEDVYFEEAQKLQQKYDAQGAVLAQEYTVSNSTAAEASRLRDDVDRLQAEQARDQRNSHAVWVDVERELVMAQKKQAWAQAQISQSRLDAMRFESVLTDEQRKKLGLPPKEKDAPGKTAKMAR